MNEPSVKESSYRFFEHLAKAMDPIIAGILDRALDGKEITAEEGAALLEVNGTELNALISAADAVRRRTVGETVTYVVNRNINFTNVCTSGCDFCAFSTVPGSPNAYTLSIEEITRRAREAWSMGATEVCIQGGLHPDIDADFYLGVCRAVKRVTPGIHIHAFSPMEIVYGAAKADITVEEHLRALKEAGLDSIPGTAAEILDDEVRRVICPRKIDTKTWVKVIKTAHRLGIPTTSTIMYGHVESLKQRSQHIALLRKIQKETRGFTEFIPLGFIHQNTSLYRKGLVKSGPTGADDVKIHAVARLMLQNFIDNVQVSWVKLGPKLAQICLNAGANDFSGTLIDENISKAAGATHGQYMSQEEIRTIIRSTGRTPAQRTTDYKIIKTFN